MNLQFHVLSVEHAHRWKWRRLQREFDVVGIIADFVTEFYHATSKSLFLRLLSLDPPRARADPEEAMMWLWKAHNRYSSPILHLMSCRISTYCGFLRQSHAPKIQSYLSFQTLNIHGDNR